MLFVHDFTSLSHDNSHDLRIQPTGLLCSGAIGKMTSSSTLEDQLKEDRLRSAEVVLICIFPLLLPSTHAQYHRSLPPLTHTPTHTGYFARVKSIHLIVKHFIELTNRKCQVVSYGAGFDTLFWILHAASLEPKTFVEVDFSSVTARKCQYIK